MVLWRFTNQEGDSLEVCYVLCVHCLSELNIMGWASKDAEGEHMEHQKFLSMFWNFLCITWIMFQGGGLQNTSRLEQAFHCLAACISLWQLKHMLSHGI